MKRLKILVIGSAHLDVLAEFDDSNQKTEIDKIGNSVSFGFGGTALNVAAHLQEMKHKPFVMTSLNKSSMAGKAIINAFRSGRLSGKYLINEPELPDSTFVGAIKNKSLCFAVSYMSVGESLRIVSELEHALKKFNWVVFDCNLAAGIIQKIAEVCRNRKINLVGTATSDKKAGRLLATSSYGTTALCMNMSEADVLMSKCEINSDLTNLRKSINTKTLMVTQGNKGWYLVQDEKTHYAPPQGIVPVTTLGAGDAACAGLINALMRELPIENEVNSVTARALRSRFPTGFAERTTTEAIHGYTRKRRILEIAGIIITTISVIIGLADVVKTFF
ncbi:MAG: PfkB family carbohydrate kinase [Gammaproteobacteria bacterium]|nr:PfkB family carbohydrate kinase [Gammaproteobacteria bacterium]MCY4337550.1 PfkB family carbohydrate kinase [Gammaproteobacteria bacterium]